MRHWFIPEPGHEYMCFRCGLIESDPDHYREHEGAADYEAEFVLRWQDDIIGIPA